MVGRHLLDRHGYLAGQDRDRATDINRYFADASVRAVLPIRGGWGSSRVLPHLDFDLIGQNPKIVLEEVFDDHIRPLTIPAWHGAMIGHRTPQFTLAQGIEVEIDAEAGRIRMLEEAVG